MKNLTLVVLLYSVLATSCYREKTYDCPAFDGTFMFSWFPYDSVGSELLFINDTGGRDSIISKTVVCGVPYSKTVSKGIFDDDNPCDVNGYIYLDVASIPNIVDSNNKITYGSLILKHTIPTNKKAGIFQFQFNYFSVPLNVIDNSISSIRVGIKGYEYEKHQEYTYHNRLYNNVVIIENDSMDKVYFAKGHGLVGYSKNAGSVEYWLE